VVVIFGHRGEVASKELSNVSGWRPRHLRGRGPPARCASEPRADNERPQPNTDEVPNLQPGHNCDCRECDRPNIICARNTRRDRADEDHGNENEDPETPSAIPATKLMTTSEIAMVETPPPIRSYNTVEFDQSVFTLSFATDPTRSAVTQGLEFSRQGGPAHQRTMSLRELPPKLEIFPGVSGAVR